MHSSVWMNQITGSIKGELFRIWEIWVSLKDEEKGKEKEVGGERKNKGVKSQVDGGEWDQEMVGS